MPSKITERGTDPAFTSHDAGFTWIAHPDEGMQRASHALATETGVWLVDPVDAAGLTERIDDHGEVAGVVLLLDRHERDAAAFARRYDVPVTMPAGVEREVDAPVDRADGRLRGTDYELLTVLDWPIWHEVGLFDGETLVVPETVGTAPFFRAGDERLGMNPVARVAPPRSLRGLDPERILMGHGPPMTEDAARQLRETLAGARWRLPQAVASVVRSFI